jgi:fatty acid desaturase
VPDAAAAPIPARLNLALLAAASLVSAALLWGASHAPGAPALIGCALLFSFTANTLFSLLHEAVHGILSPHRRRNEWAGRLAAAWFPTGLAVQRAFHFTHHRNNRSPSEQFDLLHDGEVRWLKYAQWYSLLTGVYWLVTVAGVVAFLLVPRVLRVRLLRARESQVAAQTSSGEYLAALDGLDPVRSRLEIAGSLAFQAALCVVLDLTPLGWIACYGAFALSWSALQYADHAFSPLDRHEGAWNLAVDPVTRLFFLNYHYHRAHHRHPQVPWTRLPELVDATEPRVSYWRVWRAMWKGPRTAGEAPPLTALLALPRRPLLSLPRGLDAWAAVLCTLAFLLLFGLLYGGASLLSAAVPWRISVALPIERSIPFLPAAAAVYLSTLPFLALAPFVLRRRSELVPLFTAMVAATAVAAVFFLLLPVEPAYPARHAEGAAGAVFAVADALNLERNELPSLHVALVLCAALAYRRRLGRAAALPLFAWVAAIAASTLLMHEHHLADLAAGTALAAGCWRLAARGARRPAVVEAVDVELLCLREMVRFARRHRRYGWIALSLLAASLPRWRRRRVLRTGYCCLQLVDDLLDGDRASEREPLERVDEVVAAIGSGEFGDDDLMRLARAFAGDLRAAGGEAAVAEAVELIREMQVDRRRVLAGVAGGPAAAALDTAALRRHQRRTFARSVDLMLIAGGAELRAADVPELIEAFGWCSTMRDLREDLAAGLVNVPREVLAAAAAEDASASDPEALLASAAARRWLGEELARAERHLAATDHRLAALRGRRGARVLRRFARSIRGFVGRRFPRLHPGIHPARAGPPQLGPVTGGGGFTPA